MKVMGKRSYDFSALVEFQRYVLTDSKSQFSGRCEIIETFDLNENQQIRISILREHPELRTFRFDSIENKFKESDCSHIILFTKLLLFLNVDSINILNLVDFSYCISEYCISGYSFSDPGVPENFIKAFFCIEPLKAFKSSKALVTCTTGSEIKLVLSSFFDLLQDLEIRTKAYNSIIFLSDKKEINQNVQ